MTDETTATARQPRAIPALAVAAMLAVSGTFGGPVAHADPNALWTIVDRQCVPSELQHDNPGPCALVDLRAGPADGYAVLKDRDGARQFLLIPTAPITGIESSELLPSNAVNYFAAAWRARSFLDAAAGLTLPRDWVSLAVNSEMARSQNQLHIHIDCVRADVRQTLADNASQIGPQWGPFPQLLAGQQYRAIAVDGDNLDAVNPFRLLAESGDEARTRMGSQTLVVVGTVGADGRPGFVILAGRVDLANGDRGSGEDLQDHNSCPAVERGPVGK